MQMPPLMQLGRARDVIPSMDKSSKEYLLCLYKEYADAHREICVGSDCWLLKVEPEWHVKNV
jgi:hypothetical protein